MDYSKFKKYLSDYVMHISKHISKVNGSGVISSQMDLMLMLD